MTAMPDQRPGATSRVARLPSRRQAVLRTQRGATRTWGTIPDAELLAMITGSRADAALALLDRAGGLAALGSSQLAPAGGSELRPMEADRLASAIELARRLATARAQPGWRIRSPADVGERLRPAMRHLEQEELRTLLLNTKNVVTGIQTVYVGNLAGSSVRVGEVFRDAVRCQAAAIVVVHNHPSGDPTPSADDLRITAELAQAGRLLDIELLDHVVIGADGWVSLRSLGAT
jgi:DNA repair protein RadC